jgi:superfamily II DNA/RNA helicase
MHGNKSQNQRERALAEFGSGKVDTLVATDVAARGLDVERISHVLNYDIPYDPETYVHRIGRTGRAGRNGTAVSLVNHAESMNVRRIERFTKQTIPVDVVEGFEPKRSAAPRSGARPGWKPGDGRNANAKPGQRSFHKPAGEGYRGDAPRREGGYRSEGAPRSEGGYQGQRREGGFRSEGAPRRERPAFGAHPRSADAARRTFGDR